MKLLWKVKVQGRSCVFDYFEEAYEDYKTHDKALIYPVLMTSKKYKRLPDFMGW